MIRAYAATRPRSFFVSPRSRFPSTILRFVPRDRFAFCRRAFDSAAIRSCFFSALCRSNSSSSRTNASCRFVLCDRESLTATRSPEGLCRTSTAVDTLFTCCPPGPLDRVKDSSRSPGFTRSAAIRRRIFSLNTTTRLCPCRHSLKTHKSRSCNEVATLMDQAAASLKK